MKRYFTAFLILFFGLQLTGCENMSHKDAGFLTGAVAGGLIGSTVGKGSGQVMAIAAGTVAGALIGSSIGQDMDNNDRARMQQALESNAIGQPAYWRNANTGASYRVTPVKNVTHKDNKYCREYRTTADIAGKQQQIYGTACRQPDGSWKVVR